MSPSAKSSATSDAFGTSGTSYSLQTPVSPFGHFGMCFWNILSTYGCTSRSALRSLLRSVDKWDREYILKAATLWVHMHGDWWDDSHRTLWIYLRNVYNCMKGFSGQNSVPPLCCWVGGVKRSREEWNGVERSGELSGVGRSEIEWDGVKWSDGSENWWLISWHQFPLYFTPSHPISLPSLLTTSLVTINYHSVPLHLTLSHSILLLC